MLERCCGRALRGARHLAAIPDATSRSSILHDEQRYANFVSHLIDGRAENQILKAGVAVRAHDQHVEIPFVDNARDDFIGRAESQFGIDFKAFFAEHFEIIVQQFLVDAGFVIDDVAAVHHCADGFHDMDQRIIGVGSAQGKRVVERSLVGGGKIDRDGDVFPFVSALAAPMQLEVVRRMVPDFIFRLGKKRVENDVEQKRQKPERERNDRQP